MTIYSLDILLSLFGTSLLFHVQFLLLLPDWHTDFSRNKNVFVKKKKKKNLSFREALIYLSVNDIFGLPRWASSEEAESSRRRHVRCGFHPSVGKIPWRRARQPTSVFWPGKFYGKRSLLAIVQAATNC